MITTTDWKKSGQQCLGSCNDLKLSKNSTRALDEPNRFGVLRTWLSRRVELKTFHDFYCETLIYLHKLKSLGDLKHGSRYILTGSVSLGAKLIEIQGVRRRFLCPAGERLIVASCHQGRRDESIPGSCLACILFKMIRGTQEELE